MPVIGVSGSPALKVSTVGSVHGMPTCALMRSITARAVGAGSGEADGDAVAAIARAAARAALRRAEYETRDVIRPSSRRGGAHSRGRSRILWRSERPP